MRRSIVSTIVSVLLILVVAGPALARYEDGIPVEEARRNAAIALIEHVGFAAPFLEEWQEPSLGEPTLLYDPSGNTLLYRFPVLQWGEEVGRVDAAATSLLGIAVLAVEMGELPVALEEKLAEAAEQVLADRPGAEIISVLPVVYQYPRVGVMVRYSEPMMEHSVASYFDLPDLAELSWAGDEDQSWPGVAQVRSLYRALARDELAEARMEQYHLEAEANLEASALLYAQLDLDVELYEPIRPDQIAQVPVVLANLGWNQAQVRAVDASRLKLIKQEKSDWCARAVAQMIEYYHLQTTTLSQQQIDTILVSDGWYTGNWKNALVSFYKTHQNMAYSWMDYSLNDTTTTNQSTQQAGIQAYQQQINDGFPFSDNIYGHARMGVGYRVTNKHTGVDYFEIGIYDPLQYGGGIRWELGWTDGMLGLQVVVMRYYPVSVRNTP